MTDSSRLLATLAVATLLAAACGGDEQAPSETPPIDGFGGDLDALDTDGALDDDLGPETIQDLDVVVPDSLDTSPPAGPLEITADLNWQAWSVEIRPTPAVFAMNLGAGALLLQDAEGAVIRVESSNLQVSLGVLPPILAGAPLSEDTFLVATEEGLSGFLESVWAASPLGEHISETVDAMGWDEDGERLWLTSASSLLLHSEGTLYGVQPGGLPTGAARLAMAPGDPPSLWVASSASIYSLIDKGDGLEVGAWIEGLSALDLTTDGAGRVWVAADGDLYRRSPTGQWHWLRLPSPVSALAADRDLDVLWIATADGLWRHEQGVFGTVEGAPMGTWLTVDDEGAIVMSNDDGVVRMGVGEEPLPPPPPTWAHDIEPLVTERCVLCHGPGALGANQMYLKEQWVTRIDDILFMVSSLAMPLPPNPSLDPASIARIQAWKDAGFPD